MGSSISSASPEINRDTRKVVLYEKNAGKTSEKKKKKKDKKSKKLSKDDRKMIKAGKIASKMTDLGSLQTSSNITNEQLNEAIVTEYNNAIIELDSFDNSVDNELHNDVHDQNEGDTDAKAKEITE